MKILITGASGFIGSHIAEEALCRGWEVWCAMRRTSSRRYLSDPRLHFIELDLSSSSQMQEALGPHRFDVVIHAAGATKCLHREDFFRTNTEGTRHLVEALRQTGVGRLVMMSSLSVINSIPGEARGAATAYGDSKLEAENIVRVSGLEHVILRPTGVYGPRETDYFLMVKSIMGHTDFMVGRKPQTLTFVYVDDIVRAAMNASTLPAADVAGKTFAISDGEEYSSRDFSDLIIDNITRIKGRRHRVMRLTVPLCVLKAVCVAGEHISKLTHKPTALNKDKYNILSLRDWRCDITPARTSLRYMPQVKLAEGVRRTVEWYFKNKWI
ncbi:MAG: NAD-dependent epimerase/dehydratase family protein [Prevotella sp.]